MAVFLLTKNIFFLKTALCQSVGLALQLVVERRLLSGCRNSVYLHPKNQCCFFWPISLLMWQKSGRGVEMKGPNVLAPCVLAKAVAEFTCLK